MDKEQICWYLLQHLPIPRQCCYRQQELIQKLMKHRKKKKN